MRLPCPEWKKIARRAPMPRSRLARDPGGFTLIEVMISMAVTLIVMAAVFGLLTRGQRTFQREPEVADLQQSARSALDMVARDVLQAGAGLPPEFPAFTTPTVDPAVGDQGTDPDVIEIVGGIQSPGEMQADPEALESFDGTTATLTADRTQLNEDDLVVIYNNSPTDPQWMMAWVTAVDQTVPVTVTVSGDGVPAGYTKATNPIAWNAPARVARVSVVRYFARQDDSGEFAVPPWVLMRQLDFGIPMPVGYLDDFQIRYQVGNAPPVEQDNPPDPEPLPITATNLITSVRITVTGRSTSENLEGSLEGTTGNFIRKTFSSSINPRNILAGCAARMWTCSS